MGEIKYDGKIIAKTRGLTRSEILELKKAGIPIGFMHLDAEKLAQDLDLADQAMDLVLEAVLSDEDLEALAGMPNHVALAAWKQILAETYQDPVGEKN